MAVATRHSSRYCPGGIPTMRVNQRGIRQSRDEPPLRLGGLRGAQTQCLDQQHLDEAFEDHVATGMVRVRLVVNEFDDPAQTARPRLVTANKKHRRQQCDEQRCVRGVEAEIPSEHAHRYRTRVAPVPGIAGVIQLAEGGFDAAVGCQGEAGRLGEQQEVALMEFQRVEPVGIKQA